jgi:U4/U6 small nuclear ribonucleoprotein PRP4
MDIKKSEGAFASGAEANGNAGAQVETLALTQAQMTVHNEHQILIEDLDLRKRANELVIPTNDEHVKARLEEIGEPIILFAETKPLRRQRLRLELAKRGLTEGMPKEVREVGAVAIDEEAAGPKRPFETQGLEQLREARLAMLHDSMSRSQKRLHAIRTRDATLERDTDAEWKARLDEEDEIFFKPLESCLPSISVVGDSRPLTSLSFNETGDKLATCSWNPVCKVWNVATGTELSTLKGHTERVIDISFSPNSNEAADGSGTVQLASAAADKTIRLWNTSASQPLLATLKGHDDRVNILGWHPSGKYLFASSHDNTWSLWDLATQKQLLRQDGHSRAVFGLSVHPDGSLLATGSVDASIRVWDIRSGKALHSFTGHVRQVLGVDWHPDGVLLASACEDHTARIWDMRMRKALYTIPAHQALISDIKFAPHHGKYLVTSGYDNLARVWRTDDFSNVCSLSGHDSRITALDISPAASPMYIDNCTQGSVSKAGDLPPVCIATAGFDRTWKLWTPSSI